MSESRVPRPWWQRWYALVPAILFFALLAIPFCALALGLVRHYYVAAESMAPTLLKDDRIVASMIGAGELRRGDLIIFAMPPRSVYIKRIAALPGDRIEMIAGQVILNGRAVPQRLVRIEQFEGPAGKEEARRFAEQFPGEEKPHHIHDTQQGRLDDLPETIVRPDHVFVLGDSRDKSADSRVSVNEMGVEQLPIARIRGKVLFHGLGSSKGFGDRIDP